MSSVRPAIAETKVQRSILDWLARALPDAIVFAVPNGGRRDRVTGARLKAEGVRAGAPDMVLAHRGITAFIEVKNDTGSLSKAQRQFRDECAAQAIPYAVVRGSGDLQAFLTDIGIRTKEVA